MDSSKIWAKHKRRAVIYFAKTNYMLIIKQYNQMMKILSYSKINPFFEEHASIRSNGKYGFINKNGELAIPCKYHYAHKFSEGLAAVRRKGKWGYIDTHNNIAIPFIYDTACNFCCGLAAVEINKKWGFINKEGVEHIPFVYDAVKDFNEGVAAVYMEGKYGYIDQHGKNEIPHIYDSANPFHHGIASVEIDEKSGYINKSGDMIIPLKYEECICYNCKCGVLALQEDVQEIWTLYDNTGIAKEILEYVFIEEFNEGFAVVCNHDEMYGCIDTDGKEAIHCHYEQLSFFSEGLIAACKNNKWGFIDCKGETIIPFDYIKADNFSNGLAHVQKGNRKSFFIDKNNNKIIPLKRELPILKTILLLIAIATAILMIILK